MDDQRDVARYNAVIRVDAIVGLGTSARRHYRLMDLLTYFQEVPRGYEYPLPGLVQNTSISWTLE